MQLSPRMQLSMVKFSRILPTFSAKNNNSFQCSSSSNNNSSNNKNKNNPSSRVQSPASAFRACSRVQPVRICSSSLRSLTSAQWIALTWFTRPTIAASPTTRSSFTSSSGTRTHWRKPPARSCSKAKRSRLSTMRPGSGSALQAVWRSPSFATTRRHLLALTSAAARAFPSKTQKNESR